MNHRRARLRPAARRRLLALAGTTAIGALMAIGVVAAQPNAARADSPAPAATATATPSSIPSSTPTGTPAAAVFDDATLLWNGSAELQSAPPFGGSNYFSAGPSDGTQATYLAQAGDVSILQQAADGTLAPASWATRDAQTAAGGRQQLVELSGGHAELAPDGSATVQWTGSWSINFYGGLVPFTVSDPVLTLDAAGDGALTGTLDGYAGSMSDPTAHTPLPTRAGVTVATVHGVHLGTGTTTLAPDYAGVALSLPAGQTPQLTTGAGWGAWPQSWVDYQVQTGLSSYWYSSGSGDDGKKAASSFTVTLGSTNPVPPAVPVVNPDGGAGGQPGDGSGGSGGSGDGGNGGSGGGSTGGGTGGGPTAPPHPISVGAKTPGYLSWGVKASWRSYITGPIASGSVSVAGGATASVDAYRFPQGAGSDYSAARGTGDANYLGSVHFTGHGGQLDVTFADPRIDIVSATKATLFVRVNGGAPVGLGAIDLTAATRRSSGGATSYADAPVTLTAAGAQVFSYGSSSFYPVGTAMDAVSFVIGAPAAKPSHAQGSTTVAGYTPPPRAVTPHAPPPAPSNACTVQSASLTWGFKESFRAYILSSIANGSWTEAGGASYATPDFRWATGSGSVAPTPLTGLVRFPGTVHFTGHDGALSTTIGNPQLEFADASTAYLLLDVSGATMQGAQIDDVATRFATLDLAGGTVTQSADGTVTASGIPATLSDDGSIAFPNYPAGTALDPVSFTLKLDAACAVAVATPRPTAHPAAQATATATPGPAVAGGADEASGDHPATASATSPSTRAWRAAGAVLVVLLAAAIVLMARRQRLAAGRARADGGAGASADAVTGRSADAAPATGSATTSPKEDA